MVSGLRKFVVAVLLVLSTVAVVATTDAKRFGGAIQRSTPNTVQRLHQILSIGNDPNEDIRTNRLLNLEGF
jgi:archaellum component FlaG (FlaF/FlaG flagellin family)